MCVDKLRPQDLSIIRRRSQIIHWHSSANWELSSEILRMWEKTFWGTAKVFYPAEKCFSSLEGQAAVVRLFSNRWREKHMDFVLTTHQRSIIKVIQFHVIYGLCNALIASG